MVNRLIFDENGLLDANSTLEYSASKGDDGVLEYQVSYASYDYTNSFLTISAELPDESVIEGMSAAYYDIGTTKGFKFVVRAPLTAQAGTVELSFVLRSTTKVYTSQSSYYYPILVSATINLTVADSAHSQTSTAITYDELADLQNTIQSNYATLDNKKMDKDLGTYYSLNTNPTGTEKVPLSNGTTVTYVWSNRVLNKVDTVNNVTPDSGRNVTITSENIAHGNTTVSGKFDAIDSSLNVITTDLNNKVSEGSDLVRCRDGQFQDDVPAFTEVRGLLDNTVTIAEDELSFDIALDGYDFEAGDIMQIDVSFHDSVTLNPFMFSHSICVVDKSYDTPTTVYAGGMSYESYLSIQGDTWSIIPMGVIITPKLVGTKIVLEVEFTPNHEENTAYLITGASVKVRR